MKTILIVDDEKRFLQNVEAGLKKFQNQFNVVTALNGKQATEILEQFDIDFVITDLEMPVMNGFELLAHIHSEFPLLPTVVMTALGLPDIEEKLKKTNAIKLLEKPIDFSDLSDLILENLNRGLKEYQIVVPLSLEEFIPIT